MPRRILAGAFTLGILGTVLLVCQDEFGPGEADGGQPAAQVDAPVAMPAGLGGLLITFGLKDESPTEWDGHISVSAGKIVAIDIAQGNPKALVTGAKFKLKSTVAKKAAKKKDTINQPMLRVTLDTPPTVRINVATRQGDFDFDLADLAEPGALQTFLKGQVSVLREEGAMRLTAGAEEHDYPALARGPDGQLWLAYSEYRKGKPYLTERVLLGDFDALVPSGNGDQVRLKSYDGKLWDTAIDLTGTGLDIWRPSVSVAKGRVHVSWSQQTGGKWDIYHRVYTPPVNPAGKGQWSEAIRVTEATPTEYNVVSATAADGHVWLAWQGWRKGRFQVLARKLGFDDAKGTAILAGPEMQLTTADANHWSPAIAADSTGKVYVAFDSYERGNYDVRLAEIAGTKVRVHDVAATAHFEARPSICCDKRNRVWVAYEEGDEQWGKDFSTEQFAKIGFTGNPGRPLYGKRTVRVKCFAGDAVMQAAGDLQTALRERTPNNKSMPRLAFDGTGGLWLLYRHHPRLLGNGEMWNTYAVRHDGKTWSSPRRFGNSDNLMDNRPALATFGQGLMAVFSGDGRRNQQVRKHNDLFAAMLTASGAVHAGALTPDPPAEPPKLATVHPNEAADVARIRAHRVEHEGKHLRLFRGEFHRHTEYTAHRDGDGLLEDSWRYALDAGNLDWMGNGDHDNGYHDEYSWWQIQKMAELMHHPPTFVAAQSYERSLKYPNGHRNVMFPKRGIRPMPRGELAGTEDKGAPDTHILYRYLKHFGGICSSHTSATDMGTDWRDNDSIVEPVVEIYQGHRHNYEFPGAPRSPTKKTQIGGFEPKGFVVNALDKGYKLGFQSSSDHVSTHISYAIVLTGDLSRQGIIDAFKRRRSYAATDNIIVEFRSGKHLMGDIFDTAESPTFTVKVIGTGPIAKVSLIRDGKYLQVEEPKKRDVDLAFTDRDAPTGKASYYYLRVEQADGNLAWASPMWITVKAK
jgi:hypothetical protein